jgi:signal transduction histidine kinase
VEVALRKERNSSEYEQVLRSNLEEINRMSRIVEDLLLLTRTDMGEIPLNRDHVNLTKILREVVDQLSILAQTKNLEVVTSNHDEEVHIFADALRLRQLFLNLIENSIKYTEPGGSIRIILERDHEQLFSAEGTEQNASVRIVVMDTGIGIAKEDQERIFDRFFRVDKARSRDQGGSGLGLSICKWIVEAHQGQISVESDLGKGSRFVVRLPLPS